MAPVLLKITQVQVRRKLPWLYFRLLWFKQQFSWMSWYGLSEIADRERTGWNDITSSRVLRSINSIAILLVRRAPTAVLFMCCVAGTVVFQGIQEFQVLGPLPKRNNPNKDQNLSVYHAYILNERATCPSIAYLFYILAKQNSTFCRFDHNSELRILWGLLLNCLCPYFCLDPLVTHCKTFILISSKSCMVRLLRKRYLNNKILAFRTVSEENMSFQTSTNLG